MAEVLPGARAALVDSQGRATPPFYRFLRILESLRDSNASDSDIAALQAQLDALQEEVNALPEGGGYPTLQSVPPLFSRGLLQNGFAQIGIDLSQLQVSFTAQAGEALALYRVVCLKDGVATYPDLSSSDDLLAIAGVTSTDATEGEEVTILTAGTLANESWTWAAGRIYCGADGNLTQTVPTADAMCEVARAIGAETITVSLHPAIVL